MTVFYAPHLFFYLMMMMMVVVVMMPCGVCHVGSWCSQKGEDSVGCPGTRVTDACGQPSGCWESNLGPFEEQLVALISALSPQEVIVSAVMLVGLEVEARAKNMLGKHFTVELHPQLMSSPFILKQ